MILPEQNLSSNNPPHPIFLLLCPLFISQPLILSDLSSSPLAPSAVMIRSIAPYLYSALYVLFLTMLETNKYDKKHTPFDNNVRHIGA